ncbi:hypothetical protein L3Q82_018280 [Scortum barcoo]|uniref:Uncharacterized protein n=1 Tax=Scortum barcoo TaxID=214431 RepID=A0ACB8VIT9_9TELE|nr:hypothetical protein L3Q82_018280 [Scortum barcoo]
MRECHREEDVEMNMALGYLGDIKAVLNGCEDQWTLQDRAAMPLLFQMTVCVDVRVVVPGAWVAFSYNSVHALRPELGLEGDDEALYGWLLRVRHRFPIRLSLTHWHRVDGMVVAERTVIAQAIPPADSLWLGCHPRDRPPVAALGKVELYMFRMWADLGHHGLCEDGLCTVIGWNAQYWGVTSPKARQRDPNLLCGSPLVICNVSQLCSDTDAYFWMSIRVEAKGGSKAEEDVSKLVRVEVSPHPLCWVSRRENLSASISPSVAQVSNALGCHGGSGDAVTGFIDFCQSDRQLQVVQVTCREKTNISNTTCDVLLQLSHAVSACNLQRAGVSALQQAGDKQIQATITGDVERVAYMVSAAFVFLCISTCVRSVSYPCLFTSSLVELNSDPAPQPHTQSCSSDFCDCSAFCASTSLYYAVRISISSASVSVNILQELFKALDVNRACNPVSGSLCQETLKLYQVDFFNPFVAVSTLYSCMVILTMSGPVNGCILNELLQQGIDGKHGITIESPLTRMVVCGPPGLSVSTLLASNLTWVSSDRMTSDVCQPDPYLFKCYTTVYNVTIAKQTNSSVTSNETMTTVTPSPDYTKVNNVTTASNNYTTTNENITTATVSQNETTTDNVTTTPIRETQQNTTDPHKNTTMSTAAGQVNETLINTTTSTVNSTVDNTTSVTDNTTKSTVAPPNNQTGNHTTARVTENILTTTLPAPTNTTTATSSTTTPQITTLSNTTTTKPDTGTTATTTVATNLSQAALEEQTNQLLDQTQNPSQLNSSQVAQLVGNLQKLLNGPTVSQAVGQKAINIISNLMDGSAVALSESANRMIQLVDDLGLKLVVDGDRAVVSSRSLVLAVRTVDGTNFPTTSVDIFNTDNVQLRALSRSRSKRSDSALGSVFLPSSLTAGLSPEQQQEAKRLQFTFYTKPALFQDASLNNKTLVSPVLGSSVANLSISNLSENIQFTIKNINPIPGNFVASCAFWDFAQNGGRGGWSSAGCFVVNSTVEYTTCSCNHLTSFAILLDLSRQGLTDKKQAQILTFITYIGCGISAIFLAVTLLTYLLFEKLLRDIPAKILVQLCMSLLLLNLVFLLDGWLALYPAVGLCISTAFFLHYFLLTSFTWAGLEALHMYLSVVQVFTPYLSRYMLKFSLMGWGIPLIVVIIVIAVDKNNYGLVTYGRYTDGTTDDFCWLRNDIAFYVGVVAYFLLIFSLCLLVFIMVMVQLARIKRQNPQNRPPNRNVMTDMRSVAGLIILLGLTWGFSLFAWGPLYLPFVYLFTIFNTLQGFFVFVFHCAVKENVRRQWRTYLCCGSLRLAENSDWSRTATQNHKNVSVTTATTSAPHFTSRSSSVISDATNSSGSVFVDSGISDGFNSDVVLNELHRRDLSL